MDEKVRVTCWDQYGQLTVSGIPKDQTERFEGVLFGQFWMTAKDGKLTFVPTREKLPDPVQDDEMLPFWRPYDERQPCLKGMEFDHERGGENFPSFLVKHLCGYGYTPESYRTNAERLQSYGFVCMRSPRGDDGRFWESWYLPGAWAAKGDLKEVTDKSRVGKKQTYAVVSFLCSHVSFGQLDVTVQRVAMVID